jgi:hypothetical protein
VVGHPLLPATLLISTHMDHVHIAHPYHSSSNCSSWEKFSNFSHEQMNISFSNPGFESNSNFYNPD